MAGKRLAEAVELAVKLRNFRWKTHFFPHLHSFPDGAVIYLYILIYIRNTMNDILIYDVM